MYLPWRSDALRIFKKLDYLNLHILLRLVSLRIRGNMRIVYWMDYVVSSPGAQGIGGFLCPEMLKIIVWSKKVPRKFGYSELFCYLCTVNKTKEIIDMKQSEFVRRLKKAGCTFKRQGARHEIWILPNGDEFPVPRHGSKEISPKVFNSVKDLLGL